MLGVITGFIDELREAGVPVSMVEAIDSMRALETIEVADRIALRETLRATLVRTSDTSVPSTRRSTSTSRWSRLWTGNRPQTARRRDSPRHNGVKFPSPVSSI